jgi:biopolymer transport protein ExbD
MRFKTIKHEDSIPTINLIPMLDVITVILTFFVLVSMTLSNEPNGVDVSLPGQNTEGKAKTTSTEPPPILEVKVEAEGKILVDGKDSGKEQLLQAVPAYLENNPDSTVVVLPAPEAPYEQVLLLLTELREIGSDRVSLAVGSSSESEKSETDETKESNDTEESDDTDQSDAESDAESDLEEAPPKSAEKSGGKSLD